MHGARTIANKLFSKVDEKIHKPIVQAPRSSIDSKFSSEIELPPQLDLVGFFSQSNVYVHGHGDLSRLLMTQFELTLKLYKPPINTLIPYKITGITGNFLGFSVLS